MVADKIGLREKMILSGLYLSRFDQLGLKRLGFESFVEAFNVIGYALGGKPASIKNYRDEFDPLFPNQRKGWHKRPRREHCVDVFKKYSGLDFDTFTGLIKSFFGYDDNSSSSESEKETKDGSESFAKRLITGLAAESYFESVQPTLSEFRHCTIENTSRLGCGYDFRLASEAQEQFWAVEVKGLNERSGSLSLTPKEHSVASEMKNCFFLFVVKNFREMPYHEIYCNPLSGTLQFTKKERIIIQVAWATTV